MISLSIRILSRGLATSLAISLVLPAISQILCSQGCTGGECALQPVDVQCDSNAGSSCCDQSSACDEIPSVNPGVAHLSGDCLPCACFDQEQIGLFSIPRNELTIDAPLATLSPSGIHSTDGGQFAHHLFAPLFDQRTHAPPDPIYRLTGALLI